MGSPQTRDWTRVPCVGRWILNHWTPGKSYIYIYIFFFFFFFYVSEIFLSHRHPPCFSPFLFSPKVELNPGAPLGGGFVPLPACQYCLRNRWGQLVLSLCHLSARRLLWTAKYFGVTKSNRCISTSSYFKFLQYLTGPLPLFLKFLLVSGMPVCLNGTSATLAMLPQAPLLSQHPGLAHCSVLGFFSSRSHSCS